MPKKIYLAGPDVFLPDARAVASRKVELCVAFGFTGLFPIDAKPDRERDAREIFAENCAQMQEADIGLFNLTPFRGPGADAGTIFELGFMTRGGKPVFGYTSDPRPYRARVAAVFGAHDAAGVWRDRDGLMIENFGLRDNLTIEGAIEKAGGIVCAVAEPAESAAAPLAAFKAFEACLVLMSKRPEFF